MVRCPNALSPWVLLLVLVDSRMAHASVLDLFGYGARGLSMAGAAATTARGPAAVYYNPGALAFDARNTFELGYVQGHFDLELNGASRSTREAPSAILGFGIPLPLGGALKDRLILGSAFVLPFGSILHADIARPGEPSFVLLENRAQTVSLQLALALRLSDRVGLGFGFIALAELNGDIDVRQNETGRIGSTVNDELLADYAPTFGVLLRPTRETGLALNFRGESMATFALPLKANLGDSFPLPIPLLDISGVAQYDPRQIGVEVSGRPPSATALTVAAGFTYKQWSRFPNVIAYSAVPETDAPQPAPNFHDTVVFRVGTERPIELGTLILKPRAGLAYEPTPAPGRTSLHAYLDSDRLVAALGLGFTFGALRLDLGAQIQRLSDGRLETQANDLPITHRFGGDVVAWAIDLEVCPNLQEVRP